MEERGKMSKRFVKTLFSGTIAATVLFHTLGNSSITTLAENDVGESSSVTQQLNETQQNAENSEGASFNDAGSSGGSSDNAVNEIPVTDGHSNDDTGASADNNEDNSNIGNTNNTETNTDNISDGNLDIPDQSTSNPEESAETDLLDDGSGDEGDELEGSDTKENVSEKTSKDSSEIADNSTGNFKITYLANNGGILLSDDVKTDMVEEYVDLEAETLTITGALAVADEGYEFINWTYDEQVVSEEEKFTPSIELIQTITEGNDSAAFYANFVVTSSDELTYNDPFDKEVTVDGITVTAYADAGVIPDGSVLNVTKVDSSLEAKVKEAADDMADNISESNDNATGRSSSDSSGILIRSDDEIKNDTRSSETYTFDITITNPKVNGNIQPKDSNSVKITFSNVIDTASEDTYLTVYYVKTNESDDTVSKTTEEKKDPDNNTDSANNTADNTDNNTDKEADEVNDRPSGSTTVEGLEKVSDTRNNTRDIDFKAEHFSTYTIISNRETQPYYKPAQYTPKAFKILTGTGKNLESGDFTFTIIRTDEQGNPYPESSNLYYKESGVHNDENGLISFSTLSFDTPDTYYFKLTEDIPDDAAKDPHMTYDTSFFILRLYVSEYIDDHTKLVANPAYVKNDTLPPVSVSLYDYYGPAINVDHAFKFSDGTYYYENDTSHMASMGSFNRYTSDDASKDKRLTGIVQSELVDGYPVLNPDVTGSTESLEYLFTDASAGVADKRENVILYDIGDAESYRYVNKAFFPFNNNGKKEAGDAYNYHFSVVTEAAFVIPTDGLIHTEDNPSITADMVYNFEGDDDVWVFIDGHLVIDLGGVHDKVGAELNFNTGTIQYYQYSNKNSGSRIDTASANLADILGAGYKDGQVHTLKIFYFERGKSLSEFDSDFNLALIAEFNNIYDEEKTVEGTSVRFSGTKTLTGRSLAAGEFSFELKDSDGKVIETVTNSADGSFSFSEIPYVYTDDRNDVGDHKYTINEVIGSLSGVTYDTRVYNITVSVKYDSEGSRLVATIDGLNQDGSGANFTNTFSVTPPPTPPVPPTPPTPPTPLTTYTTPTPVDTPAVLGATRQEEVIVPAETPAVLGESRVRNTGDESKILLRVFIIIICAGVIAGIIVIGRKKKEN